MGSGLKLSTHPIHLGLGACAVSEPEFTGMEWYAGYGERHASDGHEGRLMSVFAFSAPWDSWEMHPNGHEVVYCIEGSMTLIQEHDDGETRTTLAAGEYAINEPGVWHTVDADSAVTVLFITAGVGTQHRSR